MTKLLSTIALLFAFSTLTSAQPFKGQKFIGGSFSFFSQNNDNDNFGNDTRSLTLRISPRFGYMITDRTAVSMGVSFEYSETDQSFTNSRGNLITNNGVSVVLSSRHFFTLGLGMGFYLQPSVSYSFLDGENFLLGDFGQVQFGPFERETLAIGISPGVYYFLSDRIALEAALGSLRFDHSIQDNDPDFQNDNQTRSNTFSFVGGTQLSLGISYFWGN